MDFGQRLRATLGQALAVIVVCLSAAGPVSALDQEPRILMIGNSFSQNVRGYFKRLLRASGRQPYFRTRTPPRTTLPQHMVSRNTAQKLAGRPWDFVTLQEHSLGTWANQFQFDDYISRYDAIRTLVAASPSGAKIVLFMTWRDRGTDPFANNYPYVLDYPSLRGIPGGSLGYVPIAHELGIPVAPVGWAFREAVLRDPDVDLWKGQHHANRLGAYLGACVLYATIFNETPMGIPHPRAVPTERALFVQQVAHDVVFSEPEVWNLSD